jgi:hypothetical protein
MKLEEHVWATADGTLVHHGDPDAAFLRYTRGEEFSDNEWKQSGLAKLYASKMADKPADKQATRTADK